MQIKAPNYQNNILFKLSKKTITQHYLENIKEINIVIYYSSRRYDSSVFSESESSDSSIFSLSEWEG